jgi:predicted N-acetyltransferase YhbS
MHIRPATAADIEEINVITLAAKAHWGYAQDQINAWRDDLLTRVESLAERPTLVAIENGSLIGVAQVDPTTTPWELVSCWVAPSHMRRGVGRALLRAIASEVACAGQDSLHIDSDPNAESFYLALGALRVGELPAAIPGAPDRVRPQLRLAISQAAQRTSER